MGAAQRSLTGRRADVHPQKVIGVSLRVLRQSATRDLSTSGVGGIPIPQAPGRCNPNQHLNPWPDCVSIPPKARARSVCGVLIPQARVD
jgi:hypothetical protein